MVIVIDSVEMDAITSALLLNLGDKVQWPNLRALLFREIEIVDVERVPGFDRASKVTDTSVKASALRRAMLIRVCYRIHLGRRVSRIEFLVWRKQVLAERNGQRQLAKTGFGADVFCSLRGELKARIDLVVRNLLQIQDIAHRLVIRL